MQVRLVAISKLHPPSAILALYSASSQHRHLHFGENYLQELAQKAKALPRSVRWHFVGQLQTNKCGALARVPGIWCVSSVDTVKKADALEKGRREVLTEGTQAEKSEPAERSEDDGESKLRIHIQINTSREPQKSGVHTAEEAASLCRHVIDSCPSLQLLGLMTIGAPPDEKRSTEEDTDFARLEAMRKEVMQLLNTAGLDELKLELSMGMSGDFEAAIAAGSNEVRVGTGIFGTRPPREEASEMRETEVGMKA